MSRNWFVPVCLFLVTDMIKSSDAEKFPTPSGSPYRIVYEPKVEKDGTVTLKEVGKEDLNAQIQACKESTDIQTIVNYYYNTGDESVLQRMVPQYADLTVLPKSMAEFLQLRIDSENFFNALPADVKHEFDDDPNKFFAQAGQKSWFDKLNGVIEKYSEPEKKVEVNDVGE